MTAHSHGHTHGLIDHSVLRSRAGVRAVLVSLGVLGLTAAVQALVFAASGSVALLADLIHNAGDALTAVPVGAAFLLRSARAERWAGYTVVATILPSACVAGYEAVGRLVNPEAPDHLWALAAAGVVGYLGNEVAARVRLRAGRTLHSAALVADGHHARVDALVSLGVVASAAAVGVGLELADPLIGLAITLLIFKITWDSWRTVSHAHPIQDPLGHVMHDARRYDAQFGARTLGRERRFRRELAERARLAPGEAVLDVGCGTGTLAIAAKRYVGDEGTVYAIDPSPEMVARARRKAHHANADVALVVARAQQLPFADGAFDVVLASLVLHHLPSNTLPQCVAEMRRVLKPGGRVLVVDIGGRQDGRRTPHAPAPGQAYWDLDRIFPLLRGEGMTVLESGPIEFRLRRFERLRYALAAAPAAV